MNTNMTGFKWFPNIVTSLCFWAKVALSLEGLNISLSIMVWGPGCNQT